MAKAEIKSPVRGTVKRLLVNTVGGVVQPGKEVLEIVPLDEALILEAQIAPRHRLPASGAQRHGQVHGLRFRHLWRAPDAVVENIGARLGGRPEGNAFYVVRLRTRKTSLGENLPIIPAWWRRSTS